MPASPMTNAASHDAGDKQKVIRPYRPRPAKSLQRDGLEPLRNETVIGERSRISSQEHEDFSGVEKRISPGGKIAERIIRNVIDENEDQRETAKEVDPIIVMLWPQGLGAHPHMAVRNEPGPARRPSGADQSCRCVHEVHLRFRLTPDANAPFTLSLPFTRKF